MTSMNNVDREYRDDGRMARNRSALLTLESFRRATSLLEGGHSVCLTDHGRQRAKS